MNKAPAVGPMQKVSLSLKPLVRNTAPCTDFDFIFGIGTDGICGFEKSLFGRQVGDKVSIAVEDHSMHTYFDHLLCPLMEAISAAPPFDLEIEIRAVTRPSDRDVIRALAQKSGGCDADCGCGCGC